MGLKTQQQPLHLGKQTYFGEGALRQVTGIIKNYRRILLFNDQAAFKACGAEEFFLPIIEKFPIHILSYSGKALPLEDIQQLYDKNKHIRNIDLIVAVGGGTVIDLSKIYSLAYSNRLIDLDIILGDKIPENKIDLVFIPTTAGTGSEATSFAVVYKDKKKYSILHPTLLPKYTILDPGLLTSLPEEILNATVLDALAQGIESMWAAGGTAESREYAGMAISNILAGLAETERMKKSEAFQLGAHFSGKAINISKTTLPHAISYPLTSHFGIPHGIAVFLTLPKIAELNYHIAATAMQPGLNPEQHRKNFLTLFKLFEVPDIAGLTGKFKNIMEKFNVKTRLRNYGLKKDDLSRIAENSYTKGRSDNNPRKIDRKTILQTLGEIF
ncbi:MAG: phosphonoacetaldehyde reductase [Candidatus Aminicenantes bacterium]|nr:phosphonoacetaldehyde reductase [Candidatus Aminicenantes bacterium]